MFAGGIAKGHDPGEVLANIVIGTKYGRIEFRHMAPKFGAITTKRSGFLGLGKTSVVITINTINIPSSGVYWNAGNTEVNAGYLKHETGHTFVFLFGKNGSTLVDDLRKGKIDPVAEDHNMKELAKCSN